MNILLVNGSNEPLKKNLLDFFVSRKEISIVVLLEQIKVLNKQKESILSSDFYPKLKTHEINYLDKKKMSVLMEEILLLYKSFSHIFYIDQNISTDQIDFLSIDLNEFKLYLVNELMNKVNFFQVILEKCTSSFKGKPVIILVPEDAQTKLIKNNVIKSILFSSLHMLTTAIADEFIDYDITCNGILIDETVNETLEWILFQKNNKITGKLFANKQIIGNFIKSFCQALNLLIQQPIPQ